jgi:hypothetical protein
MRITKVYSKYFSHLSWTDRGTTFHASISVDGGDDGQNPDHECGDRDGVLAVRLVPANSRRVQLYRYRVQELQYTHSRTRLWPSGPNIH